MNENCKMLNWSFTKLADLFGGHLNLNMFWLTGVTQWAKDIPLITDVPISEMHLSLRLEKKNTCKSNNDKTNNISIYVQFYNCSFPVNHGM